MESVNIYEWGIVVLTLPISRDSFFQRLSKVSKVSKLEGKARRIFEKSSSHA